MVTALSPMMCTFDSSSSPAVSAPISRRQVAHFMLLALLSAWLSRGSRHPWHSLLILVVLAILYHQLPLAILLDISSARIMHPTLAFLILIVSYLYLRSYGAIVATLDYRSGPVQGPFFTSASGGETQAGIWYTPCSSSRVTFRLAFAMISRIFLPSSVSLGIITDSSWSKQTKLPALVESLTARIGRRTGLS